MTHAENYSRQQLTSTVGILCLDEKPYEMPDEGGIYDPAHYCWQLVKETVPGASVKAILGADPKLSGPYIKTAKQLENAGAGIIVSNCGYTIAYDAEIRRNVSIPVATSSLLLLPMLAGLLAAGEKIGILTFDAKKLSRDHLLAASPTLDFEKIAVGGLENTDSWEGVVERGQYDWHQLESDSSDALNRLLIANPTIAFIVVECCALCSFLPQYKLHSGVPVFDIVSLANLLIGAKI